MKYNSKIALLLLLLICSTVNAANWIQIFKNQDLIIYADIDNIKREGEVIEVWTKSSRLISTFNEPYYSLDFYRIYCENNRFKSAFAMIFESGEVRTFTSKLYIKIEEGTIAYEVRKRFCG